MGSPQRLPEYGARYLSGPTFRLLVSKPFFVALHSQPRPFSNQATPLCRSGPPEVCGAGVAPYRYTLFDVWSPSSQRLRVGSASALHSSAIRSASGASRVNSRSMPLGSLIYTERQ